MTSSTSSVAISSAMPMAITNIEPLMRLESLQFLQLAADGNNYLLWARTAKTHISADQLFGCISFDADMVVSPTLPSSISWKTLLFLRHHLVPSLQYQYLEIENPNELWQKLKSRFDHQKTIFHPRALSD